MCITASGNILASGNLCFRVFKLQLKFVISAVYTFISCALFISKFLTICYLFQTFSQSIKDRLKIKHQLRSIKLSVIL